MVERKMSRFEDGREEDVEIRVHGHIVTGELARVREREVRGRAFLEELLDEGLSLEDGTAPVR